MKKSEPVKEEQAAEESGLAERKLAESASVECKLTESTLAETDEQIKASGQTKANEPVKGVKSVSGNNLVSEDNCGFPVRDVVLFDLDGTVLDTHDSILYSMRYATQTVLHKTIPDEVLVAEVGQPLVTQMRTLAPDEETAQELLVTYRARNEKDLNQKTEPFAGIEELVKTLNEEGYTVAVVTSKRESLATTSLKAFGMYQLFARVNGMESSTGHKPDPDPLIQAAKDLGVALECCIYIGDSPFDIQAAHAAALPCIGVTWGGFFGKDVLAAESPTLLVDTMDELYTAIKSLTI